MASDATGKFSDRVDYYVRCRPRYPKALIAFMRADLGLTPEAIIADVGSGTGFLAELFLANGNTVYGVEPNDEMRAAAERLLARFPAFHSIAGRAEATTLPDWSVDLVTVGQAFHWFEPISTRAEFQRILRPGGLAALVWNERSETATPFMAAYAEFLRGYGDDIRDVADATLERFFAPAGYQLRTFDNAQRFDHDGLLGRFLSSSYAPLPGQAAHEQAIARLDVLFTRFQHDGSIEFVYTTDLYYGPLQADDPEGAP
jgi:ubiquinone/menaquinone biosynthesis C-methylase UbiE